VRRRLAELEDQLATLALDVATRHDEADPVEDERSLPSGPALGTVLCWWDGQTLAVDDLLANLIIRRTYAQFNREPNLSRRRAMVETIIACLRLRQPGERGPRSTNRNADVPTYTSDPARYLDVHDQLVAEPSTDGPPLEDRWGASQRDDDGSPLDFSGMTLHEKACRLLAVTEGLAVESGRKRVAERLCRATDPRPTEST